MKAPEFFYKRAGLGSLLATATNAVAIFLVFRQGYLVLGPAAVGIWAMIQGIMFISKIADGGSGGNVTRLVAIDRAKQGGVRLRNFIATGLLVGTAPVLVLGLLIFVPAFYYLMASYALAVPIGPLYSLIVCSLAFGVFNSSAAILSGCLDGLGLMGLRGCLSALANIIFVGLGLLFIRHGNIAGLGMAYVAYAIVLNVVFIGGLCLFLPEVAPGYEQHSIRELSRKTLNFNLGFLFLMLAQVLMDPTSKILISRFAGLGSVALFDLASKIASQARILYQAVLQSALPLLSRENIDIERTMHARLVHWNMIVARWSFCSMSLIVLASGFLSLFSLGHVNSEFILDLLVLSFGSAVNTIGLIGYYTEVGGGHLKRLVRIFALAAVSNISLGLVLGYTMGGLGVVVAYAVTLTWAGIALARPVLGEFLEIVKTLPEKIAPELFVFATASLVTWLVMIRLGDATMATRIAATGLVALLPVAVFSYREWERMARYFGLIAQRARTAFALARPGPRGDS
jgi:O-antigen/teichoic acid export membrane protein